MSIKNPGNKNVCPVCHGTGKFIIPRNLSIDVAEVKKKLIQGLREKGYSIRQIQKALGYKSPRGVSYYLNLKPQNT